MKDSIYKTETLKWNTRYFGMYTFFMTMSGFSLGVGGWFALVSLVTFTISLYAYAKNKETIELQEEIEIKLEDVRK